MNNEQCDAGYWMISHSINKSINNWMLDNQLFNQTINRSTNKYVLVKINNLKIYAVQQSLFLFKFVIIGSSNH